MPTSRTRLLEPELVAQLGRFRLHARRRVSGRYAGAHRSRRHGSSLDFADHREYVAGDDPRRVDMAAYQRLGRLLVKLYEAEDEAAVRIVVDMSASMGFGDKATAARRVAAVLTALAANGQDRARVLLAGAADGDGEVRGVDAGPWLRGPSALPAAEARLLAAAPPPDVVTARSEGDHRAHAHLVEALRRAHGEGPTGPVVLVSDLLDEEWDLTIRALAGGRGEGLLVHLLGREDLDPSVRGDLRLVDAETGLDLEVGVAEDALDEYAVVRDRWLDDVAAACGRHGVAYARLVDDEPVADLVLGTLRAQGVVA